MIHLNPGDRYGRLTIIGPAPASDRYPKSVCGIAAATAGARSIGLHHTSFKAPSRAADAAGISQSSISAASATGGSPVSVRRARSAEAPLCGSGSATAAAPSRQQQSPLCGAVARAADARRQSSASPRSKHRRRRLSACMGLTSTTSGPAKSTPTTPPACVVCTGTRPRKRGAPRSASAVGIICSDTTGISRTPPPRARKRRSTCLAIFVLVRCAKRVRSARSPAAAKHENERMIYMRDRETPLLPKGGAPHE